jgi:uncharacterized membrane protein
MKGAGMEESGAQKKHSPIVQAWIDSPHSQRILIGIVLLVFFGIAVVVLVSWGTHRPPLKVEMVGSAMLLMLAVVIWHSVIVKGVRQTVAFFLIAFVISFVCEFIGHNYAWFFGTYKYTNALGPRLGGVPILIICTWSVIIYASLMLVDWLVGLNGKRPQRTWWGRSMWALLMAATGATLTCAWDMMVDPFATSGVWANPAARLAAGKHQLLQPWWWWKGGPYLKELKVWKGAGGVPIGNFVGWWLAPFFIILIFMLFFQRENRVKGKLINDLPVPIYGYFLLSVAPVVLMMNWFENGMNQVALIGFFTMMPVILVSLVKLVRDYTPKAEEVSSD